MCKALTKKDLKCKNKSIDGSDYCRVHQNYVDRDVTIFEGRCSYILKNGRQCKHKPEKDEHGILKEYCTGHINLLTRQKEEEEQKEIINKYNKVLEKLFVYRNFFLTDEELDAIMSVAKYLKNILYLQRGLALQYLYEIYDMSYFDIGLEAKKIIKQYKFMIIRKQGIEYYEEILTLCDQLSDTLLSDDNNIEINNNVTSIWSSITKKITEIVKNNIKNCFDLNLMRDMYVITMIYKINILSVFGEIEPCIEGYKDICKHQNIYKKKWEEGNMKELRVKELKKCDVLCDDVCEYIIRKYL